MSDNEARELELIYALSRANSLAEVPGKNNWIEKTSDDGLPDYIGRIAKALIRSGKSKSTAIAIAISRVKAWAAGGDDVNADTKAKAAAALAQWEKLKASNKGRSKQMGLTNSAGKLIQQTAPYELLALSVSYSMDSIRQQFDKQVREARAARRKTTGYSYGDDPLEYLWVKEVWTDYVIAKGDHGEGAKCYRINYTVDKNGQATFDEPQEVKVKYVTVKQLADSEGPVAYSDDQWQSMLDLEDRISLSNSRKFASVLVEMTSK
jgi:hypothetical protein